MGWKNDRPLSPASAKVPLLSDIGVIATDGGEKSAPTLWSTATTSYGLPEYERHHVATESEATEATKKEKLSLKLQRLISISLHKWRSTSASKSWFSDTKETSTGEETKTSETPKEEKKLSFNSAKYGIGFFHFVVRKNWSIFRPTLIDWAEEFLILYSE